MKETKSILEMLWIEENGKMDSVRNVSEGSSDLIE